MLMDATAEMRYEFIQKITQGEPALYSVTQPGDPEKQDWWRAHQPLFYAAARIQMRDQAAA